MGDPILPENHAVDHIMEFLRGLDGLTNVQAIGILEMAKLAIFESILDDDDEVEDWKTQ